jgi:hypothetical protein
MEQDRDTSWGDYPDDASDISQDWDDLSSTKENDIDDMIWHIREGYQPQLDRYKNTRGWLSQVLKKEDKYLLIGQPKMMSLPQNPTPSLKKYTRVTKEEIDPKGGEYNKEIWSWSGIQKWVSPIPIRILRSFG